MATFLFAAQAGMGHMNPLLTLAARLKARGHRAVFVQCGPPHVAEAIAAHGLEAVEVKPALASAGLAFLHLTSGFLETLLALRLFTAGLDHSVREMRRVVGEVRPDAAVADFAFPGLYLAAEALGLPCATVYHAGLAYRGPGIPPFGSGLPIGASWGWRGRLCATLGRWAQRAIRGNLDVTRRRLGLPALPPDSYFWTSPWLTLVLTAEDVEAPRDPLPDRSYYVGPCFSERAAPAEPFPFERLDPARKKVYVSLGTVFNNKPGVFRRIIRAFAGGPHQLVVSAGGAWRRLQGQPLPANVLLFRTVPQVELLPRVDAVISHGGNNTVNETLAAGRPLLVLPVGGEQGDNAARVEHLGVGLRADLRRVSPEEVGRLVGRLLGEPSFGERAAAAAEALRRMDGPATAVRFLERMATTGRPVPRPPGYPLTVRRDTPPPWEGP